MEKKEKRDVKSWKEKIMILYELGVSPHFPQFIVFSLVSFHLLLSLHHFLYCFVFSVICPITFYICFVRNLCIYAVARINGSGGRLVTLDW